MDKKRQVIIVGGGASGLTAGIMAARNGAAVTILEQNEKPGRKICVTGNGRCNLTNQDMSWKYFHGEHPEFAKKILAQFSLEDTLRFFDELGIVVIEKKGWLYPRGGQAKYIPELLLLRARTLKVKIKTREKVLKIYKEQNTWKVQTEGWTYEGDAVILANGSKASKVPGSDGSGYVLAEELGHSVLRPLPALTGLKAKGNFFSSWAGVRTEGKVTLWIDGEVSDSETGELQLTEYGISGIPVFQISGAAARALDQKKKVSVTLNFFPEYTETAVRELLLEREKKYPELSAAERLLGLLPDKLIKVLQKQKDLCMAMTAFPLEIKGTSGFEQAQVCTGGVDTTEINPETLESLLCQGLYFAGELLDIDGPCGGYNLQWAWSSGAVAGRYAAKEQR